jgi:hypothetical protein
MKNGKIKQEIKPVNKDNIKRLNIALFCTAIVLLIVLGVRILVQNKTVMNTIVLATTVKPETFTELYFDNHLQLPSTVSQNQIIHFTFTVHNLEYRTYTYPYEVTLNENGNKTEIDKGSFTLKQNEYKTISETYTLTQPITRAKVDVDLTGLNQDIFFWINGKGANEIQ